MTDDWEGQLCPHRDCCWKCALHGEGWYVCPHCKRPFYALFSESEYEDYKTYRPGETTGGPGSPQLVAPERIDHIAGDRGQSWATPKIPSP